MTPGRVPPGRSPAHTLLSVDEFVEALVAQLDDVQDALALKAKAGREVTWALKDVKLELKVFLSTDASGRVLVRTAGPDEAGASSLHVELTTIGRELMAENAVDPDDDDDPRPLHGLARNVGLAHNDVHRLERLGVRTVGQFQRVFNGSAQHRVSARTGIPKERLHTLLNEASRPALEQTSRLQHAVYGPVVELHGVNLSDGRGPEVHIDGRPARVIEASASAVLVAPPSPDAAGQVEVRVGADRCVGWLTEDPRRAPAPSPERPQRPEGWGSDPYGGGGWR